MITELNNPDTPSDELKKSLAPLRARVNELKAERDVFAQSKDMDANVERLRREVRIDDVQYIINGINEILLYRSKNQ